MTAIDHPERSPATRPGASNLARGNNLDHALSTLSDESLICRDIGHAWRPLRTLYERRTATYERVLACSRCSTERVQILDRWGMVVSSTYHYPQHYLVVGLGRLDPNERGTLRIASLRREGTTVTEIGDRDAG